MEDFEVEQAIPRKVAKQRWVLTEQRQQLGALTRLRADLGRQLASLDKVQGDQIDERRTHLNELIRLVEGQIEEARVQVEGNQRVLRRLELSAAQSQPRGRRRKRIAP